MALLEALESRVADSSKRLESMQQDYIDIHSRLWAQEERTKSLRTLMDAREENYLKLKDRVERADWEGRLKEIQGQMKDMEQYKINFNEQSLKLEFLQKKIDGQEQSLDDLHSHRRIQQERSLAVPAEVRQPLRGELGLRHANDTNGEALLLEIKACADRCRESEA